MYILIINLDGSLLSLQVWHALLLTVLQHHEPVVPTLVRKKCVVCSVMIYILRRINYFREFKNQDHIIQPILLRRVQPFY